MQCPNCNLENPESALLCDCGYNFSERTLNGIQFDGKAIENRKQKNILLLKIFICSATIIFSILELLNLLWISKYQLSFPGTMSIIRLGIACVGLGIGIGIILKNKVVGKILWIWWLVQILVITQQTYESSFAMNGTNKFTVSNVFNYAMAINIGINFGSIIDKTQIIYEINLIAVAGLIASILVLSFKEKQKNS
jgi:hypothetical protein